MKTLVVGASEKPARYAHKAVLLLREYNHEIIALGKSPGKIPVNEANGEFIEIIDTTLPFEDVDTVTLYVNPKIQKSMQSYLLSLKPRRVIFNPGTENREFAKKLEEQGIETIEACTLVMLRTGQYH